MIGVRLLFVQSLAEIWRRARNLSMGLPHLTGMGLQRRDQQPTGALSSCAEISTRSKKPLPPAAITRPCHKRLQLQMLNNEKRFSCMDGHGYHQVLLSVI
jgi:hypothetical protein